MDIQNHCMSMKLAKLIVNAHRHNLLNSFCNNGMFMLNLATAYCYLKTKAKQKLKVIVAVACTGQCGVRTQSLT